MKICDEIRKGEKEKTNGDENRRKEMKKWI